MSEQRLQDLSARIGECERRFDALPETLLGAGLALGHARKEWGHAAGVDDPGARAFHLGIVERDLRHFDELMAKGGAEVSEVPA